MKFFFKDSKHQPNLFSSASYFMFEKDADLFGHVDYSLRMVKVENNIYVAYAGWDISTLETSKDVHKLDLHLIEQALTHNDFVIVGASSLNGVIFSRGVIPNLKYLACSAQDSNRVVDLLTGDFVELKHPISVLMVIVKVPNVSAAVCYLDSLFLKMGSFIETSDLFEEVYKYPGEVKDFLLKPVLTNADYVGDVIVTNSTFDLTVMEEFTEVEVGNVLDNSKIDTNLSFQRIPKGFRISGNKASGFFKMTPELGMLSRLSGENCALEFVVKNMSGAFV